MDCREMFEPSVKGISFLYLEISFIHLFFPAMYNNIVLVTREHLLPQCFSSPACPVSLPSAASSPPASIGLSRWCFWGRGQSLFTWFSSCDFQYPSWEDNSAYVVFVWIRNPLQSLFFLLSRPPALPHPPRLNGFFHYRASILQLFIGN